MKKKYILASINICLMIILSMLFIYGIIKINLYSLPKSILIIISLIIIPFFSIIAFLSKRKDIYNTGIFLTFLLNVILMHNVTNLNMTYNYITNSVTHKYRYTTYDVYVQKKTTIYSDIEKLNGKKIGMLTQNNQNISSYLKNIIDLECISYANIEDLTSAIENGEVQSFILTKEEYQIIEEKDLEIKDKVRIIYTSKIKETI